MYSASNACFEYTLMFSVFQHMTDADCIAVDLAKLEASSHQFSRAICSGPAVTGLSSLQSALGSPKYDGMHSAHHRL